MAVFFASDMHLRIDRPVRSQRLARWVNSLAPTDRLYLLGDVCDFWFAARQQNLDPFLCAGLRSLANFKERGGQITILAGNHDGWLGPFYEQTLGATFVERSFDVEASGLKLHLVHGHHVGGRPIWKQVMESRAFLQSFRQLPKPVANRLDSKLDQTNEVKRKSDEGLLLPYYQRYAQTLPKDVDVVVFGHIHTPHDQEEPAPRLVILGSWHDKTCYLKVEDGVANLISEHDSTSVAH